MTNFERVLIQRDGFTPEEAATELLVVEGKLKGCLDIEYFLLTEYQLEPDYAYEILFGIVHPPINSTDLSGAELRRENGS